MRLGPTLLTAAVLVGSSCADEPRATQTPTIATRTGAATDTASPDPTIDLAELCVHTDPALLPIAVYRALSCPDGTAVYVHGMVIRGADGSTLLCDAVSEAAPATCAGDGLTVQGGAQIAASGSSGVLVLYTGTVSEGVLTIDRLPVVEIVPTVVEIVPTT